MESSDLLHLGSNLAISCFIGLAIGIERSITRRGMETRMGVRDFVLVAILAFMSSMLHDKSPQVWPLAFVGVLGISLVIATFENMKGVPGLTSVLAFPTTFLLAGLANFAVDLWLIATLLFTMLLVMGLKEQLHNFAASIQKEEVVDLAILIAVALTITPLIPKGAVLPVPLVDHLGGAWHLTFHPISLAIFWKVVVLVSFMSFGCHFICKYIKGQNALLLATFFGGLVSSLATIVLLLSNDTAGTKRDLSPKEVFVGFVAANTGSITKDIIILFAVIGSAAFEKYLFPMASTLVLFAAITMYAVAHSELKEVKITNRPLPLDLVLKFSVVFACIMIFMVMATHYLGGGATILAAFFAGTISSAATLAAVGNSLVSGDITVQVAGWSTIAALMGSVSVKYVFIARTIGWQVSYRFAAPVAALAGIGSLTLWLSFVNVG